MPCYSKNDVIDLLSMPYDLFEKTVFPQAKEVYRQQREDKLVATAMLGYSNVCKNRCLYCGMRAGSKVPRYRIAADDVITMADRAKQLGLKRLFLISGEDPLYEYQDLLKIVRAVKEMGYHLSLACGEYDPQQYEEFAALGVDEYVLKFEMSDRETFDRLNPSTSFDRRMKAIEAVKKSGMKLASGNIVDYPGQTLEQLADDILLMRELEISWAPVIPYMPAMGTPLAKEGGRGDIFLNLRQIAILRLMMPGIDITAQQPGRDMSRGLDDDEGNLLALSAGANMLFADLLPDAMARNFSVVDNRITKGVEHIRLMAQQSGMTLA